MAEVKQDAADDPGDSAEAESGKAFAAEVAWVALVAVLGPAGVFITVALDGRAWGAIPLLAGLGISAWRVKPTSPGRVRLASDTMEIICALWVMIVLAGQVGWPLAVIATAVVVLATLAEQPINRLGAAFVPFVANMPGLITAPPPMRHSLLAGRLSVAALGAGVLIGAVGLPAWLWLAVAALTAVSPTLMLTRALQRIFAGRRIESGIAAAVLSYQPEFVVYTSRPDDASYQVLMWLPYLERAGRRFMIIARTNVAAESIASGTSVPVVTRRGISDLDDVVPPSLRASFYVNASSGNGAFVRYKQLTHVYLGHGDSDKPPSYNPTHAMYDRIFAAGPAAIDRYAAHGVDIPLEKFDIVGRPQVEGIERPLDLNAPRTVLYAPTWRGHVSETLLYSLPMGERIVAALLDQGMTVIFRPHPFSYDFPDDAATIERIQALLRDATVRTGVPHLFGPAAETDRSIVECINSSDALVSDVSSVVSDYLFSAKPLAIVAVPCEPDDFVGEYPVAEAAYVIDGGLTNIDEVLADLLGSDPRRSARLRIRARYLGDFQADEYAQAFVDACVRVIDRPLAVAGAVDDTIDEAVAQSGALLTRVRSQFAVYGRDVTMSVAAMAVLALELAGARTVAVALALAVLVGLVVVGRRAIRGLAALNRMLGSLVVSRTLLSLAVLVAWPSTDRIVAGVAVAILCVLTVTELCLRAGWATPGTGVRNMPGLNDPPAPRLPRGLAGVANLVVLAVAWVLVAVEGSAAVLLFVTMAALVVWMLVCRTTVARLSALDAVRHRLKAVITAYRPEFAVYFGSTIGADYQVGMWLPYFRRIGAPFIVVTRTMSMLRAISVLDDVPVIFRPTLRSLEDVIVPSLTTAFYVNNAVRNTHFIERRELTHIWLNHGDSEKPACYNPVHAIYDKLFVAGQAGIDRYARHGVTIPTAKFEVVGRPQVEQITSARGLIATLTDRTVLYAPTWKGPYADTRVYSLPQGTEIVAELLRRGVRVIFRAHPFNERYPEARAAMKAIGTMLQEDRARTGRDHLWGPVTQDEMSMEDCFNASDAMVADVSAVLSDYLKSDKPFAIVSVGRTPEQLAADAPIARAAYVIRDDLSNLPVAYDSLLATDPLAADRREARIYYLGDFPEEGYANGFLDAARRLLHGRTTAPR